MALLKTGGDDSRLEKRARLAAHYKPFFWPFYGDYWILDLGAKYEYAVVGDASRRYLWILSRTPQIDDAVCQGLLAKMADQGFDTSRVIKTLQPKVEFNPRTLDHTRRAGRS